MNEEKMPLDEARRIAQGVRHRPDGTSQAFDVLLTALDDAEARRLVLASMCRAKDDAMISALMGNLGPIETRALEEARRLSAPEVAQIKELLQLAAVAEGLPLYKDRESGLWFCSGSLCELVGSMEKLRGVKRR